MRFFILIPICLVIGCAHQPVSRPSAISPSGVIRAVAAAQTAAVRLAPHVDPAGHPELQSLEEALAQAQKELDLYAAAMDQVQKARQAAEESSSYWHSKQLKGLKEIWFWRGVALIVAGCVVGWFGLRNGWKLAL